MWGLTFKESLRRFSPDSYRLVVLQELLQTPAGIVLVERELAKARETLRKACGHSTPEPDSAV